MKMSVINGIKLLTLARTGLIQFFIEEMGEEVIKLTCAGMVNILKYVPGVQGMDDEVGPCSLALIPDEFKTQKMCENL